MFCTANEYIAIPEIEDDGTILSFNCLYMAYRGMIEYRGNPVIEIKVKIGERNMEFKYERSISYWLHVF